MHRQVGDLRLEPSGLARRGPLIRHLVMPEGHRETEEILRFIASEISRDSYVNLMDQYHPCGRAADFPPLDGPLTVEDYRQALEIAMQTEITRLDKREFPDLLQRLYRLH